MKSLEVNTVEEYLNKIPGITSSRIVTGESGSISEIHILATSQRTAKQLIRDIETVLINKLQLKVDRKTISIAQLCEDQINKQVNRLVIKSVEFVKYGLHCGKARVYLEYQDKMYDGEVEGIISSHQINRLVAEASLKAIEKYFENKVKFSLEEIKLTDIANKRVVLSSVYLLNHNEEKLLIGKSIVEGDINYAIVKSVLDAVNRFIR